MTDRDLAIARAALEAAADEAQFEHACETYHELCDCRTLIGKAIRALDPAAIVAGVPKAEAADDFVERLRDFDARDCCSQRTKAADEIERLRARVAELAADLLRTVETIKYLRGIAERGTGNECPPDMTVEKFVLGYVKQLEQDVARIRKALRAVVVNPAIINLPSDYSPETAEIFSIIESTMREGK